VSGLVVALYCRLTGARYVVEHHSAAFGRAWRWALPLQKVVVRRAATNIVTNEHWAAVVRSWGGHALVMYDAFLDLPGGEPFAVGAGPNVAFAGTFAEDEPLAAVLAAAEDLPDVHFYVTGDTRRAPAAALAGAAPNVTFTGFLDVNGAYLGLLRAVDVVVVLTTRDHTLQLAGCEAVAVGAPLVTSDWDYLRRLFETSAVYVAPTADSIRDGVTEALRRRAELLHEVEAVRLARRDEWRSRLKELQDLVGVRRGRAMEVRA
jgi:glycosyltransferase involved in cell wall biosynthesis